MTITTGKFPHTPRHQHVRGIMCLRHSPLSGPDQQADLFFGVLYGCIGMHGIYDHHSPTAQMLHSTGVQSFDHGLYTGFFRLASHIPHLSQIMRCFKTPLWCRVDQWLGWAHGLRGIEGLGGKAFGTRFGGFQTRLAQSFFLACMFRPR